MAEAKGPRRRKRRAGKPRACPEAERAVVAPAVQLCLTVVTPVSHLCLPAPESRLRPARTAAVRGSMDLTLEELLTSGDGTALSGGGVAGDDGALYGGLTDLRAAGTLGLAWRFGGGATDEPLAEVRARAAR